MSQPAMRIGDAEREQAASDLTEHYAVGRLTHDEHAERLDAIWTSRTHADLAPIFEDLPSPRSTSTPARPDGGRRFRGLPFLLLAVALIALSVRTEQPFFLLIFLVGCGLFSRRRPHQA